MDLIKLFADTIGYYNLNHNTEIVICPNETLTIAIPAICDAEYLDGIHMSMGELEDSLYSYERQEFGGYKRQTAYLIPELEDEGVFTLNISARSIL